MALGRSPDVAINHDAEAMALHAANHPGSRHYQEDVWKVDPREASAGRRVGLMWLSPDCKHFSKAKGGKPVSKRVRGLAWVAVRWAKAVKPRVIVLENVEEFQTWGPVLDNGRPCPERRGLTFKRFVGRLRALGYVVEWRELRACDFGAPTIRKRLFLVARCDGQPIVWPTPTHGKGRSHAWRTAAECIEWSIPCPSIFERKKPLAENTLRRIARGLRRFVIEAPKPFIVPIAHYNGRDAVNSIEQPLTTITANPKGGAHALVVPSLVHTAHGEEDSSGKRRGRGERGIEEPMPTTLATGNMALVSAFLAKHYGDTGQRPGSEMSEPVATITASDHNALVTAHISTYYGDRPGRKPRGDQMEMPLATQTTENRHALITSSLVNLRGTSERQLIGRSLTEPLPTISGGGIHAAEVRALLVAYYGNEKDGGSLFDPMRTVTSKDRLGLVTIDGSDYAIADIGMRMLAPRELYRAQGFPDSYKIDIAFRGKPLTKTAQVRMCGNSVCPPLAAAIVRANFTETVEAAA